MVYRTDITADAVAASAVPTERLVELALSRPTVEGRSELYGRTHAYYSIAASLPAAVEFMGTVSGEAERRRIAARALALAGYELSDIRELAAVG